MSMGRLFDSKAWEDVVDGAYDEGICFVTASGNNYGGVTPAKVVYPARYEKVIAACGVMVNDQAYTGYNFPLMQGNYGPPAAMTPAIAAYTSNIPWPAFGCKSEVYLNGAGTSSSTRQIAAAAALWFQKYSANRRIKTATGVQRLQSLRHALFETARPGTYNSSQAYCETYFANGIPSSESGARSGTVRRIISRNYQSRSRLSIRHQSRWRPGI
jgi:hypothetical protein